MPSDGLIVSKDFHENYLADKPVWFVCTSDAICQRYSTPAGNTYKFFRGQARLVKDKRDIEYFRSSKIVVEVSADEIPKAVPIIEAPVKKVKKKKEVIN